MANKKKIRLGIDVGSSFTKTAAVALVGDCWEVIAREKTPTTHQSPRGIAEGISQTIGNAAEQGKFNPADVSFVCLGTTEPACDLLQGDLAPVGIITLELAREQPDLRGGERETIGSSAPLHPCTSGDATLSLPSGQELKLLHAPIDLSRGLRQDEITTALYHLRSQGAEAILTVDSTYQPNQEIPLRGNPKSQIRNPKQSQNPKSETFGPRASDFESPAAGGSRLEACAPRNLPSSSNEQSVVAAAEAIGLPACGVHQFSGACEGEDVTRTAVAIAGALPRVTRVIEVAERSLRERRIQTPLVIMRNDGGAALRDTVLAKPLSAVLSGAAAALTGAAGWGKMRHGVFLDIGATGTSISIVKNGRSILGQSEVGGFNTYLRSSAMAVVGVGGGSIVRLRRGAIARVGPRSTSGTGLLEAVVADPRDLADLRLALIRPLPGDPEEYAVVESASGKRYALTVSGAATLLRRETQNPNIENALADARATEFGFGISDFPEGAEAARLAFAPLAARLALGLEDTAELVIDSATEELARGLMAVLRKHYSATTAAPMLYGGGGAALCCLPFLARKLGLDYQIIPDAEFLSAIGLAMGRFQETIEIVRGADERDPSEEEIAQWRQQSEARLLSLGAERDTMETHVEIERTSGVGGSPCTESVRGPRLAPHQFGAGPSRGASHLESRTTVRVITSGTILTPPGDRGISTTEVMVAPDQRFRMAADTMKVAESQVTLFAETNSLEVYTAPVRTRTLWSFVQSQAKPVWRKWAMVLGNWRKTADDTQTTMEKWMVCVCDKEGVVRLTLTEARVVLTKAAAVPETLKLLLGAEQKPGPEKARGARSGERGAESKERRAPSPPALAPRFPSRLPRLFLVHGARVSDLCELQRVEQVMALAGAELAGLDETAPVVVLAESG